VGIELISTFLLKGLLPLVALLGVFWMIKRSGKKEQQLDNLKESKKLQKKIDKTKPIKPDDLEKRLRDAGF
jgi:hypothetical protein